MLPHRTLMWKHFFSSVYAKNTYLSSLMALFGTIPPGSDESAVRAVQGIILDPKVKLNYSRFTCCCKKD